MEGSDVLESFSKLTSNTKQGLDKASQLESYKDRLVRKKQKNRKDGMKLDSKGRLKNPVPEDQATWLERYLIGLLLYITVGGWIGSRFASALFLLGPNERSKDAWAPLSISQFFTFLSIAKPKVREREYVSYIWKLLYNGTEVGSDVDHAP